MLQTVAIRTPKHLCIKDNSFIIREKGSYINCEVTLTVNGKSKTFVPKAICNGKVSDGIYVRPRIG